MNTDKTIRETVMAELKWEPAVNALLIGAMVENGVATLAGFVHSYPEFWHAAKATLRTPGVKSLNNELVVKLLATQKRSDADIKSSAENCLQWMTYYSRDTIKASVKDGWLTLSGEVEWHYHAVAAEETLVYLMGVKGINNALAVKAKLNTLVIKEDVENALARCPVQAPHRLQVAIKGQGILLTGTVKNWAEHQMAIGSLWRTPGICELNDQTELA
jgi:osmotically-inducible protein OsmY